MILNARPVNVCDASRPGTANLTTVGRVTRVRDVLDLEVGLPCARVAPRAARWALRTWCADRIEADLLPHAELLVSELANNALMNGHGLIRLRARLTEDRVPVDVVDAGSGFDSEHGQPVFEHEGPWGLDIVANLSHRWGVHEGTNHLWIELALAGSQRADPDVR